MVTPKNSCWEGASAVCIRRRTSASSLRMTETADRRTFPAGVRRSRRPSWINRGIPYCFSKNRICWDTAGWVRFSCSAARVKFMVWQTHKNVSNRGSISASITIIYRLIIKHNFLFRKTSAIIMSELSKNYLGRREAGAWNGGETWVKQKQKESWSAWPLPFQPGSAGSCFR